MQAADIVMIIRVNAYAKPDRISHLGAITAPPGQITEKYDKPGIKQAFGSVSWT